MSKKVPVRSHKRKYKSGSSSTVKRHNRLIKSFELDKSKREKILKGKPLPLSEKDRIKGGLADNIPDSQFDKEQIKEGTEVEMEHTDDPRIAKEIAKDHLVEIPDYYDYLEVMEEEAEKGKDPKSIKYK